MDKNKIFHSMTVADSLSVLETTKNGLSDDEAKKRISNFGKNKLEEGKKQTLLGIFFSQFKNIMIWVLIVAASISAFLGEEIDAIIIGIVILINAILGTIQEAKAEQALEALNKMAAPMAKVFRNGSITKIKAEDLALGDIVSLEAGDSVPADIRLIEAAALKAEEAALTGESLPSEKDVDLIFEEKSIAGDRKNMAFMGSSITYGRGLGVVCATGMDTEMGKISHSLANAKKELSPLQKKLDEISKIISVAVLIIAVVMFGVGLLTGNEVFEMFLTSVSLAVAAIPEGLVAVVTIVLAIGMQKMAANGAIIRKLPAVETLGCTRVICSDKTGTLTQNKMTVMDIWSDCDKSDVVKCMVICNDSAPDEKGVMVGDPTETALLDYALLNGYGIDDLNKVRDAEIPFDSDRKLMTVIKDGYAYIKGAPDVLLDRCSDVRTDEGILELTEDVKNRVKIQNDTYANEAYRVLAFAIKKVENNDVSDIMAVESDLELLGLCGMMDPPREEAKQAVLQCKEAGIKPVMITGDHSATATAIAKQLGIYTPQSKAITGGMLNEMNENELDDVCMETSVFARVAPQHKVAIVESYQKQGMVVAMTGDGVNDAPALKTADIGVGMGITGTDVSKAAADMVLTDDNFATIVKSVKQGRKVYQNIKKAVHFLLSSNAGEVIALFTATLIGWRILGPVHILWINLVTDTFPALALGVEPTEGDVMKRKPRDPKLSIIDKGTWISIGLIGCYEAILTLVAFVIGSKVSSEYGMTMAFLTLGISQLFAAFGARSDHTSVAKLGIFKNKTMILALFVSCALQLMVVFIPYLRHIFELSLISPINWLIVFGLSFSMLIFSEIKKAIMKKFKLV